MRRSRRGSGPTGWGPSPTRWCAGCPPASPGSGCDGPVLTDVPGVAVGHWTDEVGRTGCTVVLLPPGTVAGGEVRGGAPSTRGFSALVPGRGSGHVDAVV